MAVGFFCERIYHLLLVLSMATTEFKEDEKILFIAPEFNNLKLIVESLKKSFIFSRIYILNSYAHSGLRKWNHRFRYVYFYKSVKEASKYYPFQHFVLLTCNSQITASFEKIIRQYNPECKVGLGEDGLGTYVNQAALYGVDVDTPKARWMFSLCGLYKPFYAVKDMYVWEPDLVQNERGYHLRRLQKPSLENRDFAEAIQQIFSIEKLPVSDFLFLHQHFNPERADQKGFAAVQRKSLTLLAKTHPQSRLSMKIHPGYLGNDEFPKEIRCFKSTTPFEVALDPSIEKTTLVTLFSTAVFTPFLIWGYTPPLILLYKLADKSHLTDNLEKFVQQFRVLYEKAGGRIEVPQTWDELRDVLLRKDK